MKEIPEIHHSLSVLKDCISSSVNLNGLKREGYQYSNMLDGNADIVYRCLEIPTSRKPKLFAGLTGSYPMQLPLPPSSSVFVKSSSVSIALQLLARLWTKRAGRPPCQR